MANEFVFQADEFIETGLKTGANSLMRIYEDGIIEVGELDEVALVPTFRLFSNGMVQAAEFIELPPS